MEKGNSSNDMDGPSDPRVDLAVRLARDTQHEFNNALSVATSYVGLLAHRGGESDICDHLSRAINRATGLMDQFFYLLRENNDGIERFDLREIINDLVTLFAIFPERKLSVAEVYGEPIWLELQRHTLFCFLAQVCDLARAAVQQDLVLKVSVVDRVSISLLRPDGSLVSVALPEDLRVALKTMGGEFVDGSVLLDRDTQETSQQDLVLLLDEDPIRLEATKEMLESLGYGVLEVDEPVVAMDSLQKQSDQFVAVVVTGSLTGIEPGALLMKMKVLNPNLRTVFSGSEVCDHADVVLDTCFSEADLAQALVR